VLVTVARFREGYAAHIARGQLQEAGIEAFVFDEHLISTNWLYSDAVGGVKLQVRAEDSDLALSILAVQPAVEPNDAPNADRCPRCNSWDIDRRTRNRRRSFAFAMHWTFGLFLPLGFGSKRCRCRACDLRWVPEDSPASDETEAAQRVVRNSNRPESGGLLVDVSWAIIGGLVFVSLGLALRWIFELDQIY